MWRAAPAMSHLPNEECGSIHRSCVLIQHQLAARAWQLTCNWGLPPRGASNSPSTGSCGHRSASTIATPGRQQAFNTTTLACCSISIIVCRLLMTSSSPRHNQSLRRTQTCTHPLLSPQLLAAWEGFTRQGSSGRPQSQHRHPNLST